MYLVFKKTANQQIANCKPRSQHRKNQLWRRVENRGRSIMKSNAVVVGSFRSLVLRVRFSIAPFSFRRYYAAFYSLMFLFSGISATCFAAPHPLAAAPPMGWNDWAHYQCNYTAQTIIENARALIKTGLAARGYNTVTIDDCWMQKTRDSQGNLQADTTRFPSGMKPVAQAVHALGLKFGIYEDAGYETCGRFAGSGEPNGGGEDHFVEDAKLFASWGVDYLKLDGCNVFVRKGESKEAAYRRVYKAQSAALRSVARPIVFSESAPAYFQGNPEWYTVLGWVRDYGQLWREGSDIQNFDIENPDLTRFSSVLWNYAYNLPLGRFQSPGNRNDPDFIIGGDSGMTLAETRSQLALWSMMSAPLILSSDLNTLSSAAIAILGNKSVLAIDQDPLGKMATLVQRTPSIDVLYKPLHGGDFAVAALNRGASEARIALSPAELGFSGDNCRLHAQDLWSDTVQSATPVLQATIASHDTALWRIHASVSCGSPARIGTITRIVPGAKKNLEGYTLCLAAPGQIESCLGTGAEAWILTSNGALKSSGDCLVASDGKAFIQACSASPEQHWHYALSGNLINASKGQCLTGNVADDGTQGLTLQPCGDNLLTQIWSLPN
jgi:alpha-galactosidase